MVLIQLIQLIEFLRITPTPPVIHYVVSAGAPRHGTRKHPLERQLIQTLSELSERLPTRNLLSYIVQPPVRRDRSRALRTAPARSAAKVTVSNAGVNGKSVTQRPLGDARPIMVIAAGLISAAAAFHNE